MYHAADHTMSNAMANLGMWNEEFVRLDKARQKKGIGGAEWTMMQVAANRAHTSETPFLKGLALAIAEK